MIKDIAPHDIIAYAEALGINDVVNHSSYFKPNTVYIAIKGRQFDGADFISNAIKSGAKMIIIDDKDRYMRESANYENRDDIKFLFVSDARFAMNVLIKHFYPIGSQKIKGITGTNGKTSSAIFYLQIASMLGFNSAAIGTLGTIKCNAGDIFKCKHFEPDLLAQYYPNGITTPDAIILRRQICLLLESRYNCIILECTSQGLDQQRMDHLSIDAMGFTNLTQDHLDYHGNFENYFTAKKRAFSHILSANGIAILNLDSPEFDTLAKICSERKSGIRVLSYGTKQGDINIIKHNNGELKLNINGAEYTTKCHFPTIQVKNLMCALGLGIASNFDVKQMIEMIPYITLPPGRSELITCYKNSDIYVDYAHTPDALSILLSNMQYELEKKNRETCTQGKLMIVFGCGGERDATKRSIMGKIAQNLADFIVITDDNPRNEDPSYIREEIIKECYSSKIHVVAERSAAIKYAIDHLEENDVLIVAGKGHENYQIVGNNRIYFNDAEEIRKIIKQKTM